MDATVTKSVQEIPDDARRTLENLLGLNLQPNQQVFVMVFTPGTVPDDAIRRQAAAAIRETWKRIDAHVAAEGISGEEIDAAIDEVMRHVRPRTS